MGTFERERVKTGSSRLHGSLTGTIESAGLTSIFWTFGGVPCVCPPKIWLLSSLCATWSKPIIPHPYQFFGPCTGTTFGAATVLVALTRIDFRFGPGQYS